MRVSIVIPTFNRVGALERVVAAVNAQRIPAWASVEVIVVDDGSDDGTWAWLQSRRRPGFSVMRQSNAGPALARNRGVRKATGDIVLFLGDDTVPAAGWLWEHLEAHRLGGEGSQVAVLGYTSFPDDADSAFLRWINEFGAQFGYSIIEDPENVPFNFFYTSNISLPRGVFLAHEGFREDFPAAAWEDIEFAYRATLDGMTIVYRPRARTIHEHRIRPRSFAVRQTTAGRSGAIFAQLHPELEDFLGIYRLAGHRRTGAIWRTVAPWVIDLGDRLPGLIPTAMYRRFLDLSYLDGLDEGTRAESG